MLQRSAIMKKDLDKILSSTLKTYSIILIGIFILKICGLDYFGLDTNNYIIKGIDNFVTKFHLEMVWYGITLYIYTYVILSISCVDNSKKMKLFTLCILPICIIMQFIKDSYNFPLLFIFTDFLCLIMLLFCYILFIRKEKINKYNISNYFVYCIINILFQFISVVTRNMKIENTYTFSEAFIMNIDYIILTIMAYRLFFMKGGDNLWEWAVGSFSHLLDLLKTLPTKLQQFYLNNKSKGRFDKISDMIYIPLFLLWNIFAVVVVLFIAKLNHTFVECIIILCSFWINKKTFGKAFHMKTAISCFIVSNLTYYALNRITIPNGISLIVSVSLGIALCYFTSKLVKSKKLYRGMSMQEYDNTVSMMYPKDSVYYEIGKLFYVDRQSEQWIANKLCYSVPSVQKKKYELRDKIKEL